MAQKVTVLLTDDLDPSVEADETVSFSLSGAAYEIDLSKRNAEDLRNTLAKYVQRARKTSRGRSSAAPSTTSPKRADLSQVRAWAAENGVELSTRGRIAAGVLAAWDAKDVTALRTATGTAEPAAKPARSRGRRANGSTADSSAS